MILSSLLITLILSCSSGRRVWVSDIMSKHSNSAVSCLFFFLCSASMLAFHPLRHFLNRFSFSCQISIADLPLQGLFQESETTLKQSCFWSHHFSNRKVFWVCSSSWPRSISRGQFLDVCQQIGKIELSRCIHALSFATESYIGRLFVWNSERHMFFRCKQKIKTC